jgi:hypothetical protein
VRVQLNIQGVTMGLDSKCTRLWLQVTVRLPHCGGVAMHCVSDFVIIIILIIIIIIIIISDFVMQHT